MAVALCILSPICLIQLAGVAEYKGSISEVFATCVGCLLCWFWWALVWPSSFSTA